MPRIKIEKLIILPVLLLLTLASTTFAMGEMPEDMEAKEKAEKQVALAEIKKSFCRISFIGPNGGTFEKKGVLDANTGYVLAISLESPPKNAQALYPDGTIGKAERVNYNQYLGVYIYKVTPARSGGVQFYPVDPRHTLFRKIELVSASGSKKAEAFGPEKIMGGIGLLIDKYAEPGDLIFFKGKCMGLIGLSTQINETSRGVPYVVVKPMLDELGQGGAVEKPLLGVLMKGDKGRVLVFKVVDNSSAQKAGLQKGDVIKKINGAGIGMTIDVQQIVSRSKVGDELNVVVERDSKTLNLLVTLEAINDAN
jgi:hypothetical protein